MDGTAGSEKNHFRDPFIAMCVLAVVFFLILVVILAVWCKKRRQTEVKTVVIQPKKRPVSTKIVKQANGGNEHTNGNRDVEAGPITTDEIELSSDDQEETRKASLEEPASTEAAAIAEPVSEEVTQQPVTENAEQKESLGEVNPSFEKEEDASQS